MRTVMLWGGAVAMLASGALIGVQAQSRVTGNQRAICSAPSVTPSLTKAVISAGPAELVEAAAEHESTIAAFLAVRQCTKGLGEDVDELEREVASHKDKLEAHKEQLEELEARVAALEGKTPDPDREKPSPEPPSPGSDARLTGRIAVLERDVAALKAEVAQLKARPDPRDRLKTRAPFTVVDDDGRVLLHVGHFLESGGDGVIIDRADGERVSKLNIYSEGLIMARLSAGQGGGGRLSLVEAGQELPRVLLDASIGLLALADGKGASLAVMSDEGVNGPMIAVLSPSGETLSGLASNANGGRVFANDINGFAAFKAGVVPGKGGEACAIQLNWSPQCLRASQVLPK